MIKESKKIWIQIKKNEIQKIYAEERHIKEQKEEFNKEIDELARKGHQEVGTPFVDKDGSLYYPSHTMKPTNFKIESSTFDLEDKQEEK